MVEVVHHRNCVYQTAYHVVWCPKYRKPILTGEAGQGLKEILETLCAERGWPMISHEIQPDHVHLFVSLPPAVSIANAVRILKGTTARQLMTRFPETRKQLWGGALWSPSYYVGTAGNVSAETIRRYIERTEHVNKRR